MTKPDNLTLNLITEEANRAALSLKSRKLGRQRNVAVRLVPMAGVPALALPAGCPPGVLPFYAATVGPYAFVGAALGFLMTRRQWTAR